MTPTDIQRIARHLNVPAPEGAPVDDKTAGKVIQRFANRWHTALLREEGYQETPALDTLYLRRSKGGRDPSLEVAITALEVPLHARTAIKNHDLAFAARIVCTIAPGGDGTPLLKALLQAPE